MAAKSKFFRVATEGATTDGRKIERKWLQEIAATYSQAKYGARIFIEHIRGINPNAPAAFRAMGDVVAVKAEEVDGLMCLFAQIDPTPELVQLVKDRQKIYSSIEIAENFANTGMAYLVGLGVTDSPASLGTDILAFAAQHPEANPFTARKHHPENLFSAAELVEIEFEEEEAAPAPSILERVRAMFARKGATDDQRFSDAHQAIETVAQAAAETSSAVDQLRQDFSALRDDLERRITEGEQQLATAKSEHAAAIAAFAAQLDATPNTEPNRPTAAGGGNGAPVTDC